MPQQNATINDIVQKIQENISKMEARMSEDKDWTVVYQDEKGVWMRLVKQEGPQYQFSTICSLLSVDYWTADKIARKVQEETIYEAFAITIEEELVEEIYMARESIWWIATAAAEKGISLDLN